MHDGLHLGRAIALWKPADVRKDETLPTPCASPRPENPVSISHSGRSQPPLVNAIKNTRKECAPNLRSLCQHYKPGAGDSDRRSVNIQKIGRQFPEVFTRDQTRDYQFFTPAFIHCGRSHRLGRMWRGLRQRQRFFRAHQFVNDLGLAHCGENHGRRRRAIAGSR